MKYGDFCAWCGNAFSCERNHAKYCSNRCKQQSHRAKKRATDSGTEGLDQIEIDTLNAIRANSESAWLAILHTRRTFGLNAARIVLWASWCTLQSDLVDSRECPYQSEYELVFKGIPYDC